MADGGGQFFLGRSEGFGVGFGVGVGRFALSFRTLLFSIFVDVVGRFGSAW